MRDFFEDLGKRIGETAETMTNKAGDAIEIQRLKSQIRGLARGNAVDLMELGKMIYDRYKAGEEVEETAKGLCDAIQSRETSMEDYEKKIAKIKGASECSNCGKLVAKDMAFCPYCGEKVTSTVDGEYEETEGEAEAADSYADMMKEKAADARVRGHRHPRARTKPGRQLRNLVIWRRKQPRRPETSLGKQPRRQARWRRKQRRKSAALQRKRLTS